MANKPKVSIVILTWNQCEMTKNQLAGVAKLDVAGLDVEMIVVDNGSTDATIEELTKFELPNMKYKFIETGSNLGFAGGNNIGIKDAIERGADYVISMNNDLILAKDILVKLVELAGSDKKIGLIAPKMYFAKGFEFHKNRYKESELGKVIWYAGGVLDRNNVYSEHRGVDEVDRGQYDEICDTDYVNGACFLITKDLIKKIGLIDEIFFLYWEDADYSEKARRAGFRVMYTPETHLWHMVSVSTGKSGSPSNDYFIIRNRLIFGLRYSSLRTKFALFRDSIHLLFSGREWQKKGVIDFYLCRWKSGRWLNRKK
ncbi:MAG: glycosyltransferase family 2 protein [Candidatus Woesebacteria bacterium]|nr:MAG: glycosyltransferase family 2 protein [Candidatus Woesebacteria bacterium]